MPIHKWAAKAKWGWSYSDGNYLGIEVEGTTASGKPCKGVLKGPDLNTLKRWLMERGVPRKDAIRIDIEKRR